MDMEYEQTLFTEALGDYPITRVLDYLITGENFDYSLSDISEGACVSWSTIHKVIPALEKMGLIKNTREIGRARLYQINKENEIAKLLIEMHRRIIMADLNKRVENQKIKVKA